MQDQSATNVKFTVISNHNCFDPGCSSYMLHFIMYLPNGMMLTNVFDCVKFTSDNFPTRGHFLKKPGPLFFAPMNTFLMNGFLIEFSFSVYEQ